MWHGKQFMMCMLAVSIASRCFANLWQDIDDMAGFSAIPVSASASPAGDTPVTWPTTGQDNPTAWNGGDAATDGTFLYKASFENTYKRVYQYHMSSNTWTEISNTPLSCLYGGLVYVSGALYRCRGYYGNTFYQYSIAGNVWSNKANYPNGTRYGQAWGAHSGKIWSVGGYGVSAPAGYRAESVVYDPVANTWDTTTYASLPEAIYGGAIADWNGILYFVGGRTSSGSMSLKCWKYSDGANSWSEVASLPSGAEEAVVVAVPSKIVRIGGYTVAGDKSTNAVHSFYADTWHVETNFPVKVSSMGGAVVSNVIYVVDGYDANTSTYYKKTWISNTLH